jgi:hypothetical protein
MYQEKNITFTQSALELSKHAVLAGHMQKQDKKVGLVWRKRFFVLMYTSSEDTEEQGRYGYLFYFHSPDDKQTKSKINLRKTVKEISTKKNTLRIELKEGRCYYFSCDKNDELDKWYHALLDASQGKLPDNTADANDYIVRSKKAHKIQHTHLGGELSSQNSGSSSTSTLQQPQTRTRMNSRRIQLPPQQQQPLDTTAATTPTSSSGGGRSRTGSVLINMQVFSSRNSTAVKEQLNPWKEWGLETMQLGSSVLKFPYLGSSSGKAKRRFISVSSDSKWIVWGTSRDRNSLNRRIPVSNVRQIVYGPYSLTMNKIAFNQQYQQQKYQVVPWRCISIVVVTNDSTTRTVDLQFNSDHETLAWFVGLQSICPSSVPVNIQMSQYKWVKLKLMLQQRVFEEETKSGYSSITEVVADLI